MKKEDRFQNVLFLKCSKQMRTIVGARDWSPDTKWWRVTLMIGKTIVHCVSSAIHLKVVLKPFEMHPWRQIPRRSHLDDSIKSMILTSDPVVYEFSRRTEESAGLPPLRKILQTCWNVRWMPADSGDDNGGCLVW